MHMQRTSRPSGSSTATAAAVEEEQGEKKWERERDNMADASRRSRHGLPRSPKIKCLVCVTVGSPIQNEDRQNTQSQEKQ